MPNLFEGREPGSGSFLQSRGDRIRHLLVSVFIGPLIGALIVCLIFLPAMLTFLSSEGFLVLPATVVSAYAVGVVPALLNTLFSILASLKTGSVLVHILLSPLFGAVATLLVAVGLTASVGQVQDLTGAAGLAGLGAAAALGSMLVTYRWIRS